MNYNCFYRFKQVKQKRHDATMQVSSLEELAARGNSSYSLEELKPKMSKEFGSSAQLSGCVPKLISQEFMYCICLD